MVRLSRDWMPFVTPQCRRIEAALLRLNARSSMEGTRHWLSCNLNLRTTSERNNLTSQLTVSIVQWTSLCHGQPLSQWWR